MPDSFAARLEALDTLQAEFAGLLAKFGREHLADNGGQPLWIQLDGPAGHGKSAVLRQLCRKMSEPESGWQCAWIEPSAAGLRPAIPRQLLAALAAAASPLRRIELRARMVLSAAPGILAQRYLPVSLLVLAVLLVLSNPRILSPWGFLLAGLVAVISVIAAWTGKEAPLRIARPALLRQREEGSPRLAVMLDDLDLMHPAEALSALEDLRALTRDLPIAVFVSCDRGWLSSAFSQWHQPDPSPAPAGDSAGHTLLGRFFDLSVTVPQRWEKQPAGRAEALAPPGPGLAHLGPRLLRRHRFATEILSRIYPADGGGVTAEAISLWAFLCLHWPRLAEFLAVYPARVAHFRYEQQPPEAAPEIAAFFSHPAVLSLLRTPEGKVALEEEMLRALLAPFPPRRPPVA